MEDDTIAEYVDFSSIKYRVENLDRGSYVVLQVYSSDLNDPIGYFSFTKSDPNYEEKVKAFKSIVNWLNESITKNARTY